MEKPPNTQQFTGRRCMCSRPIFLMQNYYDQGTSWEFCDNCRGWSKAADEEA